MQQIECKLRYARWSRPRHWTAPFHAILIGSEQCIDNLVLRYSKYGSVRACVCVCVRVRVGGLRSLSLYNSKPHWYLEKEINIAISGGSRVRLPAQNAFVYFRKGKRDGGKKKKDEAENFPLVILPAELLACLESDAARRHGSHVGSALTVNISTQAKLQRKVWTCCWVDRFLIVLLSPLRTRLEGGMQLAHQKSPPSARPTSTYRSIDLSMPKVLDVYAWKFLSCGIESLNRFFFL